MWGVHDLLDNISYKILPKLEHMIAPIYVCITPAIHNAFLNVWNKSNDFR